MHDFFSMRLGVRSIHAQNTFLVMNLKGERTIVDGGVWGAISLFTQGVW